MSTPSSGTRGRRRRRACTRSLQSRNGQPRRPRRRGHQSPRTAQEGLHFLPTLLAHRTPGLRDLRTSLPTPIRTASELRQSAKRLGEEALNPGEGCKLDAYRNTFLTGHGAEVHDGRLDFWRAGRRRSEVGEVGGECREWRAGGTHRRSGMKQRRGRCRSNVPCCG